MTDGDTYVVGKYWLGGDIEDGDTPAGVVVLPVDADFTLTDETDAHSVTVNFDNDDNLSDDVVNEVRDGDFDSNLHVDTIEVTDDPPVEVPETSDGEFASRLRDAVADGTRDANIVQIHEYDTLQDDAFVETNVADDVNRLMAMQGDVFETVNLESGGDRDYRLFVEGLAND